MASLTVKSHTVYASRQSLISLVGTTQEAKVLMWSSSRFGIITRSPFQEQVNYWFKLSVKLLFICTDILANGNVICWNVSICLLIEWSQFWLMSQDNKTVVYSTPNWVLFKYRTIPKEFFLLFPLRGFKN